jgi:hypothetical protein
MSHKLRLIGYGNLYVAINNDALATQTRIDMRVYSTVYEILFLVRYFVDVIHPFGYINMASAAATNAATVVLKFNAVFQANIQYRFSLGYSQFNRGVVPFFEVYFNFKNVHFAKSNKIT